MPTDLKTILKLRVPVIVQIARRRTSMENVLGLSPGSILEFEKSADDELELLVNNKAIGRGAAVKVGENFGLRITAIGTPRQRVAALTGEAGEPDPAGGSEPLSPEARAAQGPGTAAGGEGSGEPAGSAAPQADTGQPPAGEPNENAQAGENSG